MATFPILRATPATLQRPRKRAKQTSLTLFPTAARHGNCESPCEASAPPLAPSQRTKPATELVGIARLAASSPCADAKRGTEYFLLPVRSILNHCDSERVPFRWTVNPYRGCEFGCHYCYARYTHEYMELDGNEFESKIYVKQDAGPLAGRDLANEKIWGEHIAIGTATDPYQPAEREFGATRAILEQMAEREGLNISITTKSNQVLRDIDLLKRIAERSTLVGEPEYYDAADAAGATAGAARAATGSALGGCACVARGWNCGGCIGDADRAGDYGSRRGFGRSGARGAGCSGAMVRGECVVFDAGVAETFSAFPGCEISEAFAAVSRVVWAARERAGRLSQGNHGAGGEFAQEIWFGLASGPGREPLLEIATVAAGIAIREENHAPHEIHGEAGESAAQEIRCGADGDCRREPSRLSKLSRCAA